MSRPISVVTGSAVGSDAQRHAFGSEMDVSSITCAGATKAISL